MRRVETVKPRVSYADLQRMPDDGRRYELYDGELCVVPSPLPIHEIVKLRLLERLLRYARRYGGKVFDAPFDIVLSEYNVVQPDLIYFGPESARRIRLHEHVRFAPDLAIEVLSPSTAGIDRGRKRDLLARYRVAEYWIVDPDRRQVEQYLLQPDAKRATINLACSRSRLIIKESCNLPSIAASALRASARRARLSCPVSHSEAC
jgi:Uma2 family endonuclease